MASHTEQNEKIEPEKKEPDAQIDKRQKQLTRKALQNAVDGKRRLLVAAKSKLLKIVKVAEGLEGDLNETSNIQKDIATASEELKQLMEGLYQLYEQDKYNDFGDEALLNEESLLLKRAYIKLDQIKSRETDKLLETRSQCSRHSRRSKAASSHASTSSSARLAALAEAAAAREIAEYDKLVAEREHERKKRELEIERAKEEEKAQFEKDLAILKAKKKIAVADAKLKAIDQAIEEGIEDEESVENRSIKGLQESNDQRIRDWVETTPENKQQEVNLPQIIGFPPAPRANLDLATDMHSRPNVIGHPYYASTPLRDISGSQLLESLTSTNLQIVAGLARQNLPKCQPDIFNGDATLFHPWKAAFKAMINDAGVSPIQEINYLRSFTSGEVQRLVDNYRKRQQIDPVMLLQDLWSELEKRFGSIAVITNTLLERIHRNAGFQEHDIASLRQFADLCADVESQMSNLPGLACLNYPNAIQPIAAKLPGSLRAKWEKEIAKYSEKTNGAYPGFDRFARVVKGQSDLKNNPNVLAGNKLSSLATPTTRKYNKALKSNTEIEGRKFESRYKTESKENKKRCLFHERDGHELSECNKFAAKSLDERSEWILRAGLCYRCLSSGHVAKHCKKSVKCTICGDERHIALLHKAKPAVETSKPESKEVDSKCTSICNTGEGGVSCSKTVLVDVFNKASPDHMRRVYAIIDEQSNCSMISSELADELGADGPTVKYYLSTCSKEKEEKYGRRVAGIGVRSTSGTTSDLPILVECDSIPQDKREIPTPEMARRFSHLQSIADEIPPLESNVHTHLLIGRDAPEILKVREFKNGPRGAPWAQRLSLGWTIIGQVCLDLIDGPTHVQVRRTAVRGDEEFRTHYDLINCPNRFEMVEDRGDRPARPDIFSTTRQDNQPSLSYDDRKFLEIMENGVHKNESGNWEMPLPFRNPKTSLPDNRGQALYRLNSLLRTLRRKPQMSKDYVEFMGKILAKGHASRVPNVDTKDKKGQVWYLPHFGVYHPKKPEQIRVVFDSSAEYDGTSLNKELIAGPDMMNSLLGVLIRFRKESTAVMCDIEQMFHSFHVNPTHRDFLRFLWFQDNAPGNEYRMNVHLFGNGPSPAVATFGLRKTAKDGEEKFGKAAANFVHRNFYVDDGLISLPTSEETIQLVTSAQSMLATANLRLHKVVSNSVEVMEAFPTEDRGKDIRDLDLRRDSLPAQRSLGVYWDLESDTFTFKVSLPDKPYTRRGVLSIINSIYDPLGLAVPVLLEGRLLLQQLVIMGKTKGNGSLGWDDPLPDALLHQWKRWSSSLLDLPKVSVRRCYHPKNFGDVTQAEIHAFSDASKDAIGTAVYLRLINRRKETCTALLFSQSRVAPTHTPSIPRLELCGAVLATQAVDKLLKEIDMDIDTVTYYTDSKVVLGYIQNESRRFYIYVANRVQIIRRVSEPNQWKYIDTSQNPADLATRCMSPLKLLESNWLTGPDFLKDHAEQQNIQEVFPVQDHDPEVRKDLTSHTTQVQKPRTLSPNRFERFSTFASLRRAIANLIVNTKRFKRHDGKPNKEKKDKVDNALCGPTVKELQKATNIILLATQEDAFAHELSTQRPASSGDKRTAQKITPKSSLHALDPFTDEDGILRVGGRLRRAQMEYSQKHPVILPKNHHVSRLIVRHYHSQVHHQGRQMTHGAIRQAGYWLIGGHRVIATEIAHCVTCKKLRGPTLKQRMSDLPAERTEEAPPFTNVGFDVFGPWAITTRKTRGGVVSSKRWGLIFTCLSSRAIHIEALESMDTCAFICALRRFFAIRGPAKLLRCDCGTNFVGAKSELENALKELKDEEKVRRYVTEHGCEWIFNPPHASHFGGVWERQIGTVRRVLNAMFAELGPRQLTHELFVTLMAEVSAIVNSRPITTIPTDTDDPQPLSPAMLLTMKTRPLGPLPGDFIPADVYARRRWRRVQYLADQFWTRWRREYLQSLQPRPKWKEPKRNLAVGDVVLMKDEASTRNEWPLGRVTEAIASDDNKVRKAKVLILREGKKKVFLRPIKELVLLVQATQ